MRNERGVGRRHYGVRVFFRLSFFPFTISFVHRGGGDGGGGTARFSTEHFAATDFSIRKCREGRLPLNPSSPTPTPPPLPAPGNETKTTPGRSRPPFYGQFSPAFSSARSPSRVFFCYFSIFPLFFRLLPSHPVSAPSKPAA